MEHTKKLNIIYAQEKINSPKGEDEFDVKYIIDDSTALSKVSVLKKKYTKQGEPIKAFTDTFFLLKNIILNVSFYTWIKSNNDIDEIINTTRKYILLLREKHI